MAHASLALSGSHTLEIPLPDAVPADARFSAKFIRKKRLLKVTIHA